MNRVPAALLLAAALAGCAVNPSPGGQVHPEIVADDALATKEQAAQPPEPIELTTGTADPWGRFNRGVYRFNARVDEAISLPVANGYRRVVPRPVRGGIGNFFSNLGEVGHTANHLLQLRPGRGLRSAGRFLINSTLGIGGLFDVAEKLGLEQAPTNFGNTLGRWGVGSGPYLVLPLLGPSSLRDGVGQALDYGILRSVDVAELYSGDVSIPLGVLYAIEVRAETSFRYYQTGSPFEYELIRFLYTRKRAIETGAE